MSIARLARSGTAIRNTTKVVPSVAVPTLRGLSSLATASSSAVSRTVTYPGTASSASSTHVATAVAKRSLSSVAVATKPALAAATLQVSIAHSLPLLGDRKFFSFLLFSVAPAARSRSRNCHAPLFHLIVWI
jgi:hypothetical protein